jgi:hypothetical protein
LKKRSIDAKGKMLVLASKRRTRRRELPCVRRSRSLYRKQVVCRAVPMSMGKKKRKEEAKKEQRIGLREK